MVVILKKRALTVLLSNHLQLAVVVHGNFVLIFNQNIYLIHEIIQRAIEKAEGYIIVVSIYKQYEVV